MRMPDIVCLLKLGSLYSIVIVSFLILFFSFFCVLCVPVERTRQAGVEKKVLKRILCALRVDAFSAQPLTGYGIFWA